MRVAWIAAALVAVLVGGCGGERQDEDEPEGEFRIQVTRAAFPAEQHIADSSKLRIEVRNADDETVPNVAVTVKTKAPGGGGAAVAFGEDTGDTRLADAQKPIWIVDRGPEGGDTAYTGTWSLGPMPPNSSRTFEWNLTPVRPGSYTVAYVVAPGLDGNARAVQGERTRGSFDVTISDEPVPARVDEEGGVVRGEEAGGGDEPPN